MGFSGCNVRAQQLQRARLVALQHVVILVLQPAFEPTSPALEGKFLTIGPQKCLQFTCSVVSDSLRPHELQHARPPCPSPTPEVHPDSRPSS